MSTLENVCCPSCGNRQWIKIGEAKVEDHQSVEAICNHCKIKAVIKVWLDGTGVPIKLEFEFYNR